MLTVLVPLIIALAAPVPSPSEPPVAPSPLKEIGHVESLTVCSAIVVHANSAISVALDNDRDLTLLINRLQTTDLDDDNTIKRRNAMNDLSTLASRLRMTSAGGSAEIKRLRAMAVQTVEPTRKAELKAFADALGGAIGRQRKAGTDIDHMLAIIDGRRAVEEVNTQDLIGQREAIAGSPADPPSLAIAGSQLRNPAAPATPLRVNEMLRTMAADFLERVPEIRTDEGTAADHSLGATTGC